MQLYEEVFQVLLIGIANGAIIALIACGYPLVYGIIELINFAHGDVFMIGTMTSLTVVTSTLAFFSVRLPEQLPTGILILLAIGMLLAAMLACGLLNVVIERLAYRRLRNAPRLAPLITAIGVSFILVNVGLYWGSLRTIFPFMGSSSAAPKNFPDLLPRVEILKALGLTTTIAFTTKDLLVIVVATMLMVAFRLFVQRTRLGK